MRRDYRATSLVLACSLALAGESVNLPPSDYQLSDVIIRLVRSGGGRDSTVFEISGTGKGSIRHIGYQRVLTLPREESAAAPGTASFVVSEAEVLDLINTFHDLYFFQLDEVYGEPQVAVLEENDEVRTYSIADSHSPSTTVTIEIGDFKKSSKYLRSGPPGLEELVRRIEAVAGAKTQEVPGSASK